MFASQSHSHSLPGPEDIHRVQFENGIVSLSRANFNSPSVVISGMLNTGAMFDPDEKLGLADFTALAIKRGTARHTFQEIYDILESVGANLGLSSNFHSISFGGRALVEDLDMLLSLLVELLYQPTFPSEHVERLRAQILTSLAIRAQNTGDMASLAFDQIVYANHPYRHPEDGYPETIQAITQNDLVEFHRTHFGPHGMLIAIVGAVDPARAAEKVYQAFGDWFNPLQPRPPDLPPLQPLQTTIRQHVTIPGKSQADLVIGTSGPARTSPDYIPASLGNNILGQFGMMGRIGEVVREKAGLAYYASSNLSGGPGPGPWDVSAGVDPTHVQQVTDLIIQEIRRFTTLPVEAEELADTQASYIGSLPLSLESNHGVAQALLNLERHHLDLDYYLRYPDLVKSVNREKILASAQRYLDPDRLAIASAGP